ncbi:MAG: BBE domain-containing protein [Pseudonocardia sp.]|nr:BBE domain-containing protein [Pseudonocardia sp.]
MPGTTRRAPTSTTSPTASSARWPSGSRASSHRTPSWCSSSSTAATARSASTRRPSPACAPRATWRSSSAPCPATRTSPRNGTTSATCSARWRPTPRGGGTYINSVDPDEGDRIRSSYGAAKFDRLARVKAVHDPENVFHHNTNIPPVT